MQEVVYSQLQLSVVQFVRAEKPPTAGNMVQAADAWVAEGKFVRLTAWKRHNTWKGPRPQRPSDRLPYRPGPQQRDHLPLSQPLSEVRNPLLTRNTTSRQLLRSSVKNQTNPIAVRTMSANTLTMSKVLSVLIAGNGDTSAQLARIETSILSDTPNHLNQQSPDCRLFSPCVPLGKANANVYALSCQESPDEPTACTTEKEGGDVRST